MAQATHPDGLIRIYSPRLIAELQRSGCRPIVRHRDGEVTFARTGTVKNIIEEYADGRRRTRYAATPRRKS